MSIIIYTIILLVRSSRFCRESHTPVLPPFSSWLLCSNDPSRAAPVSVFLGDEVNADWEGVQDLETACCGRLGREGHKGGEKMRLFREGKSHGILHPQYGKPRKFKQKWCVVEGVGGMAIREGRRYGCFGKERVMVSCTLNMGRLESLNRCGEGVLRMAWEGLT